MENNNPTNNLYEYCRETDTYEDYRSVNGKELLCLVVSKTIYKDLECRFPFIPINGNQTRTDTLIIYENYTPLQKKNRKLIRIEIVDAGTWFIVDYVFSK